MKLSDTMAIVENCFHGQPASCTHSCPVGLDVRGFMDKASKGKWTAAYKMLRNAVVFPAVASRLCPAPCKTGCQRAGMDDGALSMPLVERAAIAFAKKKNAEKYVIPQKEQTVAVVGAGVSGLSCALDLAQKRYIVTLFDKREGWGGALRDLEDFGIYDEDFALQFGAVSFTEQFGHEVKNLDELSGFDAVYLATGKGGDEFGLLHGFDPMYYTTNQPGVFLGGGLCGEALMEAVAMGTGAARHIAAFLQTGRVDSALSEKRDCSRHVTHFGEKKTPAVVPASGNEYTEDEAMLEAARCMQCDCSACMDSCEMLSSFRKKPKKIATEVYTDTQVSSTFSTRTLTRQTYSCNMCNSCKSVCPEGINMGSLFSMSRRNRFESGAAPFALHDYWLREMDFNKGEASFFAAPDGDCEYVFYPGCRLGAHNPAHVLKAYEYLKSKFACGVYLGCCGAPAFWAGDGERLNENIKSVCDAASALGNPVFVHACATCGIMFDEFLPEIKHVSLYKILADDKTLNLTGVFPTACVFDPCAARGDDGTMNAVRAIAKSAGTDIAELPVSNLCCGYGGLVQGGNPKLFERIANTRAEMSENPYIVYCANCREVFLSHGKDCVHILEIVFGLPKSMEVPTISGRRQNSLYVKSELMRELKNAVYEPEIKPWDSIRLVIGKGLADEIDRKLISEDDMKETIWMAESSGEKFINETDGSSVAYMTRRVLTYWVQYGIIADGEYEIKNAYYHRMSFKTQALEGGGG